MFLPGQKVVCFLPGQKAVCVDDVFPDAIKKFYWKLAVKGVAYTVRDLIPGIDPSGEPGEKAISKTC